MPAEERADTASLKQWLAVLLNTLMVDGNLAETWSTWGRPISDYFEL
jgi:hypothetical protein